MTRNLRKRVIRRENDDRKNMLNVGVCKATTHRSLCILGSKRGFEGEIDEEEVGTKKQKRELSGQHANMVISVEAAR